MSPSISPIIPTAAPVVINVVNPPINAIDWLGLAGFGLSVLLAVFELYKYINDKGKLKITHNYKTIYKILMKGNSNNDYTLMINVTNTGSKTIYITGIKLIGENPLDDVGVAQYFKDTHGKVELVPYDVHTYKLSSKTYNLTKLRKILVFDGTGKMYTVKIKT